MRCWPFPHQCEQFVETNEEAITDWYFGDRTTTTMGLQETLCPSLLKDISCLTEPYGELVPSDSQEEQKGNRKGDTASSKHELWKINWTLDT